MAELAIAVVASAGAQSAVLAAGYTAATAALAGQVAFALGSMAGAALMQSRQQIRGPRLDDKRVEVDGYGQSIPEIYGSGRMRCEVLWASDRVETKHRSGGKGGPKRTSYTYHVNAIARACRGPIEAWGRIWANGTLIYDPNGWPLTDERIVREDDLRLYLGTEDQLPDPTYEGGVGTGNAPAHRGYAYFSVANFQLEKFGNQVPVFEAEVFKKASITGGWTSESLAPHFIDFRARDYIDTALPWVDAGGVLWILAFDASFDTIIVSGEAGNWAATMQEHAIAWPFATAYGNEYMNSDPYSMPICVDPNPANPYVWTAGEALYNPGSGWVKDTYLWRFNTGTSAIDGARIPLSSPASGAVSFVPDTAPGRSGKVWTLYDGDASGQWGVAEIDAVSLAVTQHPLGLTAESMAVGIMIDTANERMLIPIRNLLADADAIQVYTLSGGTPTFEQSIPAGVGERYGETSFTAFPGGFGLTARDDDDTLVASYHIWDWNATYGTYVMRPKVLYQGTDSFSMAAAPVCVADYANDRWLVGGVNDGGGSEIEIREFDTLRVIGRESTAEFAAFPMLGVGAGGTFWMLGDDDVLYQYVPTVVAGLPEMLDDVVTQICERHGLSEADIDVSELASEEVHGYLIGSAMSARAKLEQLAGAHFFDVTESEDKIAFRMRGRAPVATIDDADVIAGSEEGFRHERNPDLELPRQVTVRFVSSDNGEYDSEVQPAFRRVSGATAETSVDLAQLMSPDRARRIAHAHLYAAHLGRQTARRRLPMAYSDLEPTDVVNVPVAGELRTMRIKGKRESSIAVDFDLVLEDASVVAQLAQGAARAPVIATVIGRLGSAGLVLLDLPPLRESDNQLGRYVAAYPLDPDAWGGAIAYLSTDGGVTWSEAATFNVAATVGFLATQLDGVTLSGPVPANEDWADVLWWDEDSQIDVEMHSGTLASATEAQVYAGQNAAVIGHGDEAEIIGFRDVTLVASRTYRLSGLLRGRRSTRVRQHVIGTSFVLLDSTGGVRFVPLTLQALSTGHTMRAVASGEAVSEGTDYSSDFRGRSVLPLHPTLVQGERDGSGNLSVTWLPQNRFGSEWLDGMSVPLDEPVESYRVRVYASASSTTVKREEVVTSATWAYSAADQIADFGTAQDPVYLSIAPLSELLGYEDLAYATGAV